jgi:hypothetical protein
MKELLGLLHKRHKVVAEKYGKHVAVAAHAGEGVYLGSALFASHEFTYYVYGGLFVVWIVHTLVIGAGGEHLD